MKNKSLLLLLVIASFSILNSSCSRKSSHSEEVLKSFYLLDKHISISNNDLDNHFNNSIMRLFHLEDNDYWSLSYLTSDFRIVDEKIYETRDASYKLVSSLYAVIDTIIELSGRFNPQTNRLTSDAGDHISSDLMIKDGQGKKMRIELIKYQNKIMSLVDSLPKFMKTERMNKVILESLPIPMDSNRTTEINESWEHDLFDNIPAIGAIAIIRKYISSIKRIESLIINEIELAVTELKQNHE